MDELIGWEADRDPPDTTPECNPFPSLEEIIDSQGGLDDFLA